MPEMLYAQYTYSNDDDGAFGIPVFGPFLQVPPEGPVAALTSTMLQYAMLCYARKPAIYSIPTSSLGVPFLSFILRILQGNPQMELQGRLYAYTML